MTKAVTIYEVAERAGVSISTVSNVLNRPAKVGAATRDRVLAISDELGFVPKAEAVRLAQHQLGRIGVVAPFSSYATYWRRLAGVLSELAATGTEVSVFDQESAASAASPLLASIPVRGRIDGLVVMGEAIEELIERRLFDRGLPVVVVDATSPRFPTVAIDDFAGGRLAADHLLAQGHRRFGYLVEEQASSYESQAIRRLEGFRAGLNAQGGCELDVVACAGTSDGAHQAARRLLAADPRPTAVMAHFDELAVGVLRAAVDHRLRVPDDLSVMGFDDGPVAAAVQLTTVRQPFEQSGSVAARLLLGSMKERTTRTQTQLELELVVRATVAPPRPAG